MQEWAKGIEYCFASRLTPTREFRIIHPSFLAPTRGVREKKEIHSNIPTHTPNREKVQPENFLLPTYPPIQIPDFVQGIKQRTIFALGKYPWLSEFFFGGNVYGGQMGAENGAEAWVMFVWYVNS